MPVCAYCGQEKPTDEMTQEHVLPAALGGKIRPTNPFSLRTVCGRCNSACGRHVDGPFIRDWTTVNDRARAARQFADISTEPVLPLTYVGRVDALAQGDQVCELWIGPSGDSVYHFYRPHPGQDDTVVGRPLNVRPGEYDPGFVMLLIVATNPVWHPTIVLSVMHQFKGAPIHFCNSNVPSGGHPRLRAVPEHLSALHQTLLTMRGVDHEARFNTRADVGDRFLGKLALGFGALFLHHTFVQSPRAVQLRNFMWSRDARSRSNLGIRGARFLDTVGISGLTESIGWRAGHVFLLLPGDTLTLAANFYGSQLGIIEVTSEQQHWDGHIDSEGAVYVVAPGRGEFRGPVSLPEFLSARLAGAGTPLGDFLSAAENPPELPPFHLPEST